MSWTETVRQNHLRAQAQLARRVNRSSVSVPIGDSPATAPGWLNVGYFYSCVPDPAYPWDPAVVRAFREISDDVVPIIIKSVWRWSNYYELGHFGASVVLTRHGIARAVKSPMIVHQFRCEMPSTPTDGFRIPGRSVDDCAPNYIEIIWADRYHKELSEDLPGAYLPFDWEFFHLHRRAAEEFERDKQRSRRQKSDSGDPVAVGVVRPKVDDLRDSRDAAKAGRRAERDYERRDILSYHREMPSDVELKNLALGGPKQKSEPVSVTVSASASAPTVPAPVGEPSDTAVTTTPEGVSA